MAVIYSLYFMLRPSIVVSSVTERLLSICAPLASILIVLTLPIMSSLTPDAQTVMRNWLVVARDGLVTLYLLTAFIPTTYRLWQQETVVTMRLKHLSGLLFDYAYLIVAGANVLVAANAMTHPEAQPFIESAFKPAVVFWAALFMLTIMPHRWWSGLFLPARVLLLLRLHLLETRVAHLTQTPRVRHSWQGIEGSIYRKVIFILDRYAALELSQASALRQRIAAVVQQNPEYPKLVEQLARLV